jgi:hypothetical protein
MKILYVTTLSNTVNAFLIPHIKMLIENGHTVDVAFNIEQDIKPEIPKMGCKINVICFARNPLKLQNIKFEQDNFKWLISIFKFENCSKRGPSILKFVCRIYRFQLLFKYIQKGTLR